MNSKIDFQILIATMHRENIDFLYKMFPHHNLEDLEIIIINQTTNDKILESNISTVNIINSFEKGLSKSRNLALENATRNWCLISDDDLVYLEGFEKKIEEGISLFSKSGVIIFQAEINKQKLLRNYPNKSVQKLGAFQKMDVTSFELLINKDRAYNDVRFNEFFGLGSEKFLFGEESVFINDVENIANCNVSFYKKTIVQHPWLSTGRKLDHPKWYFTKGAIYFRIFPRSYYLWIFIQLFFDLKQHRIKISTIFKVVKEMIEGSNALRQLTDDKH